MALKLAFHDFLYLLTYHESVSLRLLLVEGRASSLQSTYQTLWVQQRRNIRIWFSEHNVTNSLYLGRQACICGIYGHLQLDPVAVVASFATAVLSSWI